MQFLRKNIYTILVIAISIFISYYSMSSDKDTARVVDYTKFVKDIDLDQVTSVTFHPSRKLDVKTTSSNYSTVMPIYDDKILEQLLNKKVQVVGTLPEKESFLMGLLRSLVPILIMVAIWFFFMRMMGANSAKLVGNNKKINMLLPYQIDTRLDDVAGLDEARVEVSEIIDYLKDPAKFEAIGGKIPKGVLMVGPPGTGKTLLARAIAGEAGVAFFPTSGSDFVEMFVGVGASRVRQLFAQARKNAPCIIFIDEIDAVGRKRGSGMGGGNDEREQTLNQILVEMDGFEGNEGVIVISATNRVDVLDNALVRPGRFDRQVYMGLPDIKGREQILKVHSKKVLLDPQVDLRVVARATPGFSGADLANLVNEAALLAARHNAFAVSMKYFEMAQDKIVMGTERKTFSMSYLDKERTAYHEAGHAIVGYLTPGHDPVHKVTIVPRGRALGVTYFLPEDDKVSLSLEQLDSQLQTLYAGRLAEEIIYGPYQVTTGASNDIERASQIAYRMVTEWGFSNDLGPIKYSPDQNDQYSHLRTSSDSKSQIDKEVRDIIERNYAKARSILINNRDILEAMKDALLEYETIDRWQIKSLMTRQELQQPRVYDTDAAAQQEPVF